METKNSFYEEYKRRLAALDENDMLTFTSVDEMPHEDWMCMAYVGIICTEGSASCRLGDKTIEVNKNDMFLGQPRQFVEDTKISFDFEFVGFLMSPNYFESIFMLCGFGNTRFILQNSPVIHLNDEEIALCITDHAYVHTKLNGLRTANFKESIKHLVQSIFYEMYDILAPKLQSIPFSYTSSELLFQRFSDLVIAETPLHREVKYYADRLCITPKYLSVICKQQSGKTASSIINNFTTEYIKRTLRTTNKSVKEIAEESGFQNVSFFGKYVRRELGMSPREFRLTNT